ncbi:bifunctional 3'-5' exonuclease/DNA polymerase [Leucobacter sp. NPDC015123]|uniref:bifunctional 3'-5' exonuclease/DNA polymerase n=1 Tax=Leucobacter sp. NPDC015123 TaxID=3364129 RepID=UPI000E654BA9
MRSNSSATAVRWCALGRTRQGDFEALLHHDDGTESGLVEVAASELPGFIRELELAHSPRWIWQSAAAIYPRLLAAGISIARCHDLRLCHQILRNSRYVRDRSPLLAARQWHVDLESEPPAPAASGPALFDLDVAQGGHGQLATLAEVLAEYSRQRTAVTESSHPGRLSLLLAAESAGSLIAAELAEAGIPWDAAEHDRILTAALGPRPASYAEKPALLAAAAARVREALDDPLLSLDSPPKLLRALRAAGVDTSSTSQWELAEHSHPALEPLLEYKKLSRLLTANGWAWLDEWVQCGRYRPVYVPGGVVTGRWASNGGGALQLPRALRPALRADPGWKLVIADVSQLEPRVLAAMSQDTGMAAAGRDTDLYAGIVATSSIENRDDAKLAMLGAMYGATSGDSGRLVPQLRRVFPQAMGLVDRAAELGERGGIVTTWLGRSSPEADAEWHEAQSRASAPGATRKDEDLARRSARERGRFTRNFVVQGTAAEWALAWLAEIRKQLSEFPECAESESAKGSGTVFSRRPHLAFFLHDEIIVHTPEGQAAQVAEVVRTAATRAGNLLFPTGVVDFRLDLHITDRATKH